MKYPNLPQYSNQPTKPLKICVVTREILGPFRNGGIATANTGYAKLLAKNGHHVTVLYITSNAKGPLCAEGNFDDWVQKYRQEGIELRYLECPQELDPELFSSLRGKSWSIDLWLAQRQFDVVHFDEYTAPGYYTIMAKKTGQAHQNTVILVKLNSGHQWLHEVNDKCYGDIGDFIVLDMEKFCRENTDFLIGPSQYLINWCAGKGETLPVNTYSQQNVMPEEILPRQSDTLIDSIASNKITEIVFFGRHEVRKGLVLFCDAMDKICQDHPDLTITFMGKFGKIYGEHSGAFIIRRASKWKNKINFFSRYSSPQAVEYLRGEGRLAVMPSISENLPTVVTECLLNSIPFISTAVGGTGELINAEDHAFCLAEPTKDGLSSLIKSTIDNPPKQRARVAYTQNYLRDVWTNFYNWIAKEYFATTHLTTPQNQQPLVTICVVHYNQPRLLAQTIQGIEAQDYQNIEVVLVDDGSTKPAALTYLKYLEEKLFPIKGWKLLRQKNSYLGAARNAAASQASGDYLIFMDDDNYAHPTLVSSFVKAAQSSNADILTCFSYFLYSIVSPDPSESGLVKDLPLGVAGYSGFFKNFFGDANALFKKTTFESLGGFLEDRGHSMQDWHIFSRALLEGLKLYVVPRPLYWYRVRYNSMFRTTPVIKSIRTIAENYASTNSKYLLPIIELSLSSRIKHSDNDNLNKQISASPHRDLMKDLQSANPNSDSSLSKIIEIAMAEERFDLALQLSLQIPEKQEAILNSAQKTQKDSQFLSKSTKAIPLSVATLRTIELLNKQDYGFQLLMFKDQDVIQLHPITNEATLAFIPGGLPKNSGKISADICVENKRGPSVLFGVFVSDISQRQNLLKNWQQLEWDKLNNWSGWHRLNEPLVTQSLILELTSPSNSEKDIFLVTAIPQGGSQHFAHATFKNIKTYSSSKVQKRRPRTDNGLVVNERCFFPCSSFKHQNAYPLRKFDVDFLPFKFEQGGMFMHPVKNEVHIAVVKRFYPSEESCIKATVCLRNKKSNPVQFGIWVASSDSKENWEENIEIISILSDGFSGWVTVNEVQKDITIEVPSVRQGVTENPRDIYFATKVPKNASAAFCHAVWRYLEIGIYENTLENQVPKLKVVRDLSVV
ncbi:MAG: DUF6212 domain-containing protein [Cyanobacteria bacterium P01_F01_bin.143]